MQAIEVVQKLRGSCSQESFTLVATKDKLKFATLLDLSEAGFDKAAVNKIYK